MTVFVIKFSACAIFIATINYVFFISTCVADPQYMDSLRDVEVSLGENVDFTCAVGNIGSFAIIWRISRKGALSIYYVKATLNQQFNIPTAFSNNSHGQYRVWTEDLAGFTQFHLNIMDVTVHDANFVFDCGYIGSGNNWQQFEQVNLNVLVTSLTQRVVSTEIVTTVSSMVAFPKTNPSLSAPTTLPTASSRSEFSLLIEEIVGGVLLIALIAAILSYIRRRYNTISNCNATNSDQEKLAKPPSTEMSQNISTTSQTSESQHMYMPYVKPLQDEDGTPIDTTYAQLHQTTDHSSTYETYIHQM